VDQSKNYAASRDLEAVANHAPQGATIVQHRSPLWYMTLVEHRRRDLHVVEAFPSGGYSARGKRWAKRSGTYLRKGSVYILFPPGLMRRNAPYFDSEGYRLIPKRRGDFYEVVVKERKTTPTRTTST
jgi:hypothetical protein